MCGEVEVASRLLQGREGLIATNSLVSKGTKIVLTATFGLLHLVLGEIELGERYYWKAHKRALQAGQRELANRVSEKMHLEMARAYMKEGRPPSRLASCKGGLGN